MGDNQPGVIAQRGQSRFAGDPNLSARPAHLGAACRAAVLIVLGALAGCQSPSSAALNSGNATPECRAGRTEGCRVAALRQMHIRVRHRHHVAKAAWHRRPPTPTERDVDAILAGIRRAKADSGAMPSPSTSSP